MTQPPGSKPVRTSAELLAEVKAEVDGQDTPVVEPFRLTLKNGTTVTFRNPDDIPTEEADAAGPGLAGQLRLICSSRREFRQLWAEWGKVEQRYIRGLLSTVIDYYEEAGKGEGSSS